MRNRELLVLLAMRLEGGRYEWSQHLRVALAAGIQEREIAAIEALDFVEPFSETDRALLLFGKSIVEDVRVTDTVYSAVRAQLSEREIVEAVLTIGYYMMLARATEALQIDLDPDQGLEVIAASSRT